MSLKKENPYKKIKSMSTEETEIFDKSAQKLEERIEKIFESDKINNHRVDLLYARYNNEIELLNKLIEFKENQKDVSAFEIRALKCQLIKMNKKIEELKQKEVNSRLLKSSAMLNTLSSKISSMKKTVDDQTKNGDNLFSITKSKIKLQFYTGTRKLAVDTIKLFNDSLYNGNNVYMQKFNAKIGNVFGTYKDDIVEYEESKKTR